MTLLVAPGATIGCGGEEGDADDAAGDGDGDGDGDPFGDCDPNEDVPLFETAPSTLSETGLYADLAANVLAPRVWHYEPKYALWSDAAAKRRWVHLPGCEAIDATNLNVWAFPVGTSFWKEFAVGGNAIETRFIHRFGPGPNDFVFATYLWNSDHTEADLVEDGVVDASGTNHDVPSTDQCLSCHGNGGPDAGGVPERVLGFSYVQLPGVGASDDIDIDKLVTNARLDGDVPNAGHVMPGNAVEQAAFGALHGNCSHCHNNLGTGLGAQMMSMYVLAEQTSAEALDTVVTTVGVDVLNTNIPDFMGTKRVVAGLPDESAVAYRMSQRGNGAQMPPLGTEVVDNAGYQAVVAWIESLGM